MASVHGKGTTVLVDGYNLSAFLSGSDFGYESEPADDTCYGDSDRFFIGGLGNGSVALDGKYDSVAAGSDVVLQGLRTVEGAGITIAYEGLAIGARTRFARVVETSVGVSAPVGDIVVINAEFQATLGAFPGASLHALTAETVTGFGASVDGTAATTGGWAAILHATGFSGAAATITGKLADSADNSVFADVANGGFTARTTVGSQVIYGAPGVTLRRYVRAAWTISGTTPSITFHVSLARL